jgi:hypothetical protein
MHKKMKNVSVLNHANNHNDIIEVNYSKMGTASNSRNSISPSVITMIAEGGENFYLYLKRHDISRENNMLVLPSVHHYYYDENELGSVRTLVNLKKLNHIKHLDGFLQNLIQILPRNANFIGCFSNDKTLKQNGFAYYKPSRILRRLVNFIDSKTDRILDRSKVIETLERNGYKIVDMTEMDGLTYFYTQNAQKKAELKIA